MVKRMPWGLVIIFVGLMLVGAGVWAQYGWPLAAVVEGVTMIIVAVLALVERP